MKSVDIFCRVIDNYGDIGVCWRLARQLSNEHALHVRLIVDDLGAFRFIAPTVNVALETQQLPNVTLFQWDVSALLHPADIVIEAFACDPPESYISAMAAMTRPPAWINLEYLSAEAWVDGVHGLPSPHPRLRLTKHFFCPGFSAQSGGLIRESAVNVAFAVRSTNHAAQRVASPTPFVVSLSNHEPATSLSHTRPRLFAFTYPHAPVRAFATALNAQVTQAAPIDDADENWRSVAPVPQPEFDALLAQFDVLIVRGEDSFVRAQYAAKPMLWHIYPTPDDAHLTKLDAWLDYYCTGLSAPMAATIRHAHHAFNHRETNPDVYAGFAANLPAIAAHAERWRQHLCAQSDLATRLLTFISLKEKQKVS